MKPSNIQFLIAVGNVEDGFKFTGPFANFGAAEDCADSMRLELREREILRVQTHGFTFILGDGCTNDHYITYVAESDYAVATNVAMVRAVEAWLCDLEDIEIVGVMYGDCVAAEWANSGGKA